MYYGGAWGCPLNPDVRRYVIGLVEDLATRDLVSEIELGEYWYPISPLIRGRVSCFCKYCKAEAKMMGINLDEVLSSIRKGRKEASEEKNVYEEAFTFDGYSRIARLSGFDKASKFWSFRMKVVSSFVFDLADIIQEYGVRVSAVLPPPDLSKALGVDYRALSRRLDLVKPALYHRMFRKGYWWFMLALRKAKRLSGGKGVPALLVLKGVKVSKIEREIKEAIKVWKRGVMLHSYGLASPKYLEAIGNVIKRLAR